MARHLHGQRATARKKLQILATFCLTAPATLVYGRGMITRDQWTDYVGMLTDAELSELASVLVEEQRKRDEAAQRLADEQAAREWAEKEGKS